MELECTPYGTGQAGEGICLLVKMGPYRILLDCGLADLRILADQLPLTMAPDAAPPIDLVLCSHAHPDHARSLLALHQALPQVPIYTSEATAQLLALNWLTPEQPSCPRFWQTLPWRSLIAVYDDLTVELWPAGHLPGAAAILLAYTPSPTSPVWPKQPERTYRVFYTGDFFLSSTRLTEGLPLEELRGLKPDVLILEGTYGTARHPRRRQQENQLAERIHRALTAGYRILMPVPMLGLGQDLLMLLRSHHLFTGRDLDIWVDGQVAIGCDAYLDLLPYLPSNVQNFARHQPLFWDDRIRPRVRRLQPDNRAQVGQTPCLVLTDLTLDWQSYYTDPALPWLVLISEQPDHRPDLAIQQPAGIPPNWAIESYLLADHCDGAGTTQLIHNLRPQHVVLVHGSPAYLADLTNLEELQSRYQLHCPAAGKRVELPIGETFMRPNIPESGYEGEVIESETTVSVLLPERIITDPRWLKFADTGLVAVRWQGEELVLRGFSQRELLSRWKEYPLPVTACCAFCQHYRTQHCRNPASPLYQFKVSPEGYCPAYEPPPPPSPG
ncbi:MBL fold metallo-hydrolase [Trichothermofontia sp.]